MSKMDDLRAMREAKYEQNAKRTAAGTSAPKRATPAKPPVAPPVKRSAGEQAETPPSSATPAGSEPALCGHRNMSGRTCTREAGHAAKSHRYS